MYAKKDVVRRFLQVFDIWSTPDQVAQQVPQETIELIVSAAHALEGPYLLVLLWLSTYLLLLQGE